MTQKIYHIKAVIGLGNPGPKFHMTRHNIGFLVLDALCDRYHGNWQARENMEQASITLDNHPLILIKPQTFMNTSGAVIPFLTKQGIKPENILVIHDELELPFGKMRIKHGGSARGHNGLRSIIERCGADFPRLSFGIGRPEQKEMVGDYVLQNFSEKKMELEDKINAAVSMIEDVVRGS
ncbi:MAG: aminoacyl-tRNA hydrolase [Candidatus Babeliales bacterium]